MIQIYELKTQKNGSLRTAFYEEGNLVRLNVIKPLERYKVQQLAEIEAIDLRDYLFGKGLTCYWMKDLRDTSSVRD